jgi:hypothetical protein
VKELKKVYMKRILLVALAIIILFGGNYILKYLRAIPPDIESIKSSAKIEYANYTKAKQIDEGHVIIEGDKIFVFFHNSIPERTKQMWEQDPTISAEELDELINRCKFYGFVQFERNFLGKHNPVVITTDVYDTDINNLGISGHGSGTERDHVEYGIILDNRIKRMDFYHDGSLQKTYNVGSGEDYYLVWFERLSGNLIDYEIKMYDINGVLLFETGVDDIWK